MEYLYGNHDNVFQDSLMNKCVGVCMYNFTFYILILFIKYIFFILISAILVKHLTELKVVK